MCYYSLQMLLLWRALGWVSLKERLELKILKMNDRLCEFGGLK